MRKLSGHICDSCRTMFKPNDVVYELCTECYNTVWCVVNVYKDGKEELSSIHRTEEMAKYWVTKNQSLLDKLNPTTDNPIIDQKISQWCVF